MKLLKPRNKNKMAEALRDLFETTLKQELATYLCLKHASKCVTDQQRKTLFTVMAESEKEHLVTLLRIANKPMDIFNNIDQHMDDPAFHEQVKDFEQMEAEEIILVSIRNERSEVEKYGKIIKEATDKKALEMLGELLREEKEHVFLLEQIYAQQYNRLPSEEDFKKLPPQTTLMLP